MARRGDVAVGYQSIPLSGGLATSRVSGAQTLAGGRAYTNTSTAAVWTLPAAAVSADQEICVLNAASGTITVNSASGSEIFSTAARASVVVRTGMYVRFICDGVFWYPMVATRTVVIQVTDPNAAGTISIGDGQAWFTVPVDLANWRVSSIHVAVTAAPTSGLPTFQVENVTQGWPVMLTSITVPVSAFNSYTGAGAVDTTSNHDLLTQGDRLRFDIDAVGAGVKGVSYQIRASL